MKNKVTLVLFCLVLVVSGMAQPRRGIVFEKHTEKVKHEKLFSPQKQTSLLKIQVSDKKQKSDNWWEPDTIYGINLDNLNERRIFSYENGNCTVDLIQKWNNNQWVNSQIMTYSYDSQSNLIEFIFKNWISSQWENDWMITFTYDSQKNITFGIIRIWESGQWVNYWKETYTYDSQNNATEVLVQGWDLTQWRDEAKYINSYDTYKNLTEELVLLWQSNQWINYRKYLYTYDVQNLMSLLFQNWENAQWKNDRLNTYTYDSQNNNTTKLWHFWSSYSNEWINTFKDIFTYDDQNNLTSILEQINWPDNGWQNSDKSVYVYDESNNAISGYCQTWNGYSWINSDGLLSVFYNNMQSGTSVNGHRFTATYIKSGEVGINESNFINCSVRVYPNPVSTILHIETNNTNKTKEINIYSIHGTLLINSKENQIDVSPLPSGIYIVKVEGITRKIVKQ
ncbi:MAG: T9SS type A sorting domain-containing protein [Bacteroidetes bacterium]|nr:T9SS type A sorting domain-containing protein [Bacteroidota bacterium]